jgi:hypothetical protein
MPAGENATRVDLPALRNALITLQEHELLVIAALRDLEFTAIPPRESYRRCLLALDHIVHDGYRDNSTRGDG